MNYSFDESGWLSATPIEGRQTSVAPPDYALPTGCGWNWSGLAWVAAARDATPTLPPVPASVSMRQAKRALLAAGLLDAADLAIAGIADDAERRAALIDWTSATEVRRDWPLVAAIAQALHMTDAQIDALFIEASTL